MSSATTVKENFRLSRWLVSRYGGRIRDFFNNFVVKSSLIQDKAQFRYLTNALYNGYPCRDIPMGKPREQSCYIVSLFHSG